jgi:hypothetical protein
VRPSDRPADLPDPFDVDLLRRRAKDLRRAALAGDGLARERVRKAHPRFGRARLTDGDLAAFTLRDAQLCVAREMGFDGWTAVLAHAQGQPAGRPWQRWPDRADMGLFLRAVEVAQEVGTSTLGPECAIAALVRPPAEGPAATVLAGLGLTWPRWLHHYRPLFAQRPASPRDGICTNPAWHGLMGVAEGIALASGARLPADEHVLLALAYHRTSEHPSPLEDAGVAPDAVVSALAALGIAVSDLRPPAASAVMRPPGPRVYFDPDDADAIIDALGEAYPLGSGSWGFNYDDDRRPYVEGEAELDVEGVARRAVADPATVTAVPVPRGQPWALR